jgi:hypothetical protein
MMRHPNGFTFQHRVGGTAHHGRNVGGSSAHCAVMRLFACRSAVVCANHRSLLIRKEDTLVMY